MMVIQQYFVVLFSLLFVGTQGFHPSGAGFPWGQQRVADISRPFSQSTGKLKETAAYDESEVKEMEEMIISLSLEPTDDSRRERLKSIFDDALAKPNGMPKHFSDLFDYALVIVGDRVKLEAQEHALKIQEQMASDNKDEETEDSEDASTQPAFPQQRQLWALIDMMVQSKTIVKRASGELGSKGTFQ